MLNRRMVFAAAAGLSLLLAAPASPHAADSRLKVVASFSILGDMVKEIGKSHVEVTTLVGPDGDAHVYEPTPADAKTLAGAKLLVVNGLHFETWLPRLVKASGFKGMQVVASQGVTARKFEETDAHEHESGHGTGHEGDHDHKTEAAEVDDHNDGQHGHDHGSLDPHAWQDLANGMIYAQNIAEALAKADPAHAADYQANAAAYIARLESLDKDVRAAFASIPPERCKVVTSHDAFGYFGAAYGIAFIAPTGISTESEASAADVARIIDQIKAEGITAVFVETITNTKLIDQIARETGAAIGGALYSDALSPAGGPASTYIKMFEWNTKQLTNALKTS